jgi:hypothetical protein
MPGVIVMPMAAVAVALVALVEVAVGLGELEEFG